MRKLAFPVMVLPVMIALVASPVTHLHGSSASEDPSLLHSHFSVHLPQPVSDGSTLSPDASDHDAVTLAVHSTRCSAGFQLAVVTAEAFTATISCAPSSLVAPPLAERAHAPPGFGNHSLRAPPSVLL